jgi:hypothetical protein
MKLHYRAAVRLLTYEGSGWRYLGCARVQNALRWPLSWKATGSNLQKHGRALKTGHAGSSSRTSGCYSGVLLRHDIVHESETVAAIMDCGYEEWSHPAYNAVLFTTDCGLRVALHLQMLFVSHWLETQERDFSAMANRRVCGAEGTIHMQHVYSTSASHCPCKLCLVPPPLCQSISSSYFVVVCGKSSVKHMIWKCVLV